MQVAVVYGMLCSQCTESVSVDDAAWIVEVIEVCFDTGLPTPWRSLTRIAAVDLW